MGWKTGCFSIFHFNVRQHFSSRKPSAFRVYSSLGSPIGLNPWRRHRAPNLRRFWILFPIVFDVWSKYVGIFFIQKYGIYVRHSFWYYDLLLDIYIYCPKIHQLQDTSLLPLQNAIATLQEFPHHGHHIAWCRTPVMWKRRGVRKNACETTRNQWEFQDPKMEVPIIYTI